MTKLAWDQVGDRLYETGVSNGVLYMPNPGGVYDDGVAWNGLVTVTESPSGASSSRSRRARVAARWWWTRSST